MDDFGQNAAFYAVQNEKLDALKLLVSHGIDLNIISKNKVNVLHLAEKLNNSEIILMLKEGGAKELTSDQKKELKNENLIKKISIGITIVICLFVVKTCSDGSSNSGGSNNSAGGYHCTCVPGKDGKSMYDKAKNL